jgi:hypothetical protein
VRKQVPLLVSVDDDNVAYIGDKRIGQFNHDLSPEMIVWKVEEELADMLRINLGRSYRSDDGTICW